MSLIPTLVERSVEDPTLSQETAVSQSKARMICPCSNATRNNIDVKLSITPADGNDYDVT